MKKNFDYILFISIIALTIFGIVMIYSASNIWAVYKFNDAFKYVKSQSIFFIIGIIMMIIISKINTNLYYKYSNHLLISCIILLILVLIPGVGIVRNGSRSWFGFGGFGVQPSEATKLALIIFTSKYLSNNSKYISNIIKGVFPILFTCLFCFGLIMLQPDFGTGVITVMSIVALLFISGVKLKFFGIALVIGLIGAVILTILAPYRLARILSYLNPWSDPLGSGFQIIQSLFAIGPGGLLGMGFLNSIQKNFYLPEPQSDFIFSIISEEFGFMGVIIVVGLFLTIIYRCIKISLKSTSSFDKYLVYGIIFQISFQALLNLMVVVGLIPVTGVTLPFLSYGGSSLLITLCSMGIVLNISKK